MCAADDFNPPHHLTIELEEGKNVKEILRDVCKMAYLPKIAGGKATWSAVSNIPLALIAEQWREPKIFPLVEYATDELEREEGCLKIHFNYHSQIEPDIVYDVLYNYKLRWS